MEAPAAPAAKPEASKSRSELLRAAGDAYFKRILEQEEGRAASRPGAGAPLLPAAAAAPPGGLAAPAGAAAPALPKAPAFDTDFLQVEAVVEGSRTYVLGTLLVIGQAAGLVFVKASLDALTAPALLAFVHLLPTAATLWLLAAQGALDLGPLSARAAQGAAPTALLSAAKTLLLFPPRRAARSGCCSAGLGALLAGPSPGLAGLLYLLLWAAVEAAEGGWDLLRQRPELLSAPGERAPRGALAGREWVAALRSAAEAEASLPPASLVFLQQALPVLPVLVLGFAAGEGAELVDHELSVPAVTVILLSVLCWAAVTVCGLLAGDALSRPARAALLAAAPLGTAVTEAAVHGVAAGQAGGLVAALAAVAVGLGLRLAASAKGDGGLRQLVGSV
eukprot:scaffold12.g8285.t1